ncbi:hypothetical protein CcrC1_gp537 [Caulobacter phage C1]|nr:hypothetical protein CcrC1_gp044 [Caulobacter phage C1]UTU08271.1 hypothetical protein CcrC2_gp043 [Caulobacter phage C2]UTU08794.1 hypothetical protein CcrJ4_gp043 [Caulobacter phage J4]UTU09334.1 hypothetical protein CcrBL47_gp048 [Caulobacter phage BL47]UTU09906.1 hypothetical protein CcrRB23_gp044 [Caulobacter phage RB23]WGN96931.1 hypothetical protein [Bertelyvirus sp.]
MARTADHTTADRTRAPRDLAPWELDAERRRARKASKSWRAERKGVRSMGDYAQGDDMRTLADGADFYPN